MKIIRPSVEIVEQAPGLDGIYKQIEQAGRNCYQSSHLIGENTAKPFVDRMIRDGHTAMLEHGTVYLQMPLDEWIQDFRMEVCPGRTHVVTLDETNSAFVTTNYRVLVENDALDLLKYLCDKPEPLHELRVTARFSTQIAISREFNRHRVNSIAEESTRYCNYSKGKYGSEITVCVPSWLDYDEVVKADAEIARENKIFLEDTFQDNAVHQWLIANYFAQNQYLHLLKLGWTAQQARTVHQDYSRPYGFRL